MRACFQDVGNMPRVYESWNSLLRIGASSGAQVLSTIAGIPSGVLDLEVSSWRRVWRTFCVENLMGDIVKFEGGSDEVGPLGRPGWTWSQRLTQKYWPWMKEF